MACIFARLSFEPATNHLSTSSMAQFTSDNLIPVPYALQDEGDFSKEFLAKKDTLTLSESFSS
jgi:hypothetical protein